MLIFFLAVFFRENIQTNKTHNFNLSSHAEIDTHGVGYDYLSIMHYGKDVSHLILYNLISSNQIKSLLFNSI